MYVKYTMVKVKSFFIIFSVFFYASVSGADMADKFDWLASESAPHDYPMQIVSGSFYDPDGGVVKVPSGKTLHHGWGEDVSTYVVGPELKALPNRLEISFFSYAENQFYKGEFTLPYERISQYFSRPYYSHKVEHEVNYSTIIAGVAPGGYVSVWLGSVDRTVEVFSGQADKTGMDWSRITNSKDYTRDEYVALELGETLSAEALDSLKKNGVPVGKWKKYQKRYNWQLSFSGQEPPKIVDYIKYFNGERDLLLFPQTDEYLSQPHAVPKAMTFAWDWPVGKPRLMEFKFDENEIMHAFHELEKDNLPIYLDFFMRDGEKGRLFSVLLKTEKHEFYLKKTDLETYGVPKS